MEHLDFPPRPWVPELVERRINERAAQYRHATSDDLEAEVEVLLDRHEQLMDRECISLYAGTNLMNPRAARWLAHSVASRPSLGYPGDKYETGLEHAEQLEILAAELLRQVFRCRYVEFRVPSGSVANLYAFMATTKPGDTILSLSVSAAGHVTHHAEGAAGLYGLRVQDVPFDGNAMTVDVDRLHLTAQLLRPRLIVIGASMCLFPYPVADVRAIADEIGAYVLYDAAHVAGLIAGGAFQQPLDEGAHLMTCSTYKSFGGPPSGLVLTDELELARRLDAIAYPGLTANFDLGKLAALIVAALDVREHGAPYAARCIANAQRLAAELAERGVPVHEVPGRGHTESHHVALPAHRWGGGTAAARRLEPANLLASGIGLPLPPVWNDWNGLRLGTQEVTRLGMEGDDMAQVADLLARVLVGDEEPSAVRDDVIEFRRRFQELHFVR